jgi:hypothetical protein
MKKLLVIAPLFFLSLIIFMVTGCEKELDPPVFPPGITLTAIPLEPEFKGLSIVSWSISNFGEVISVAVFIDGEEISQEFRGSIKLDSLEKNVSVKVVCQTKDRSIEKLVQIVPRAEVQKLPSINLYATPPGLPFGGGTIKLWWLTKDTDSVFYDGNYYGLYDSVMVEVLLTTTFTAKAVNKWLETTTNLQVIVQDPPPPPTPLDLLQSGKWYENEAYITVPHKNIVRQQLGIGECEADNYFLFGQNLRIELNEGPIACEGALPNQSFVWQYSFIGDTIQIAQSYPRYVEILNDTILVWHVRSNWHENGISYPTSIEQVFKHTLLTP